MTSEIVTTSVIAAFLVILLAGFLFGLGRGFNKSLVRLLIVVATLVITFFVVPSITKALMTVDISSLGISISGETATTVPDIIVSILNNIPQITDITNTTAYATIISVVPQMILNVVLFVIVFILLRLVSMIIYWIISGICFNKKKTEGKNKHRLLGSLVGVVQNFLIFLVILVPVVGTVNILGDVETITTQPTTEAVSPASASLLSNQEENAGETSENYQVSPYQTINDVIDAYNDSWVAKFLHGIKLDNVCMYVFDELSTVTENQQEYNLRVESNNFAQIAVDVMALINAGEFDLSTTETVTALNKVIDSCYNSKLTAGLINEVLPEAAAKWKNGEDFCTIKLPEIGEYQTILNTLLDKIAISQDLQSTLKSTVQMAQSILSASKNIVTESGSVNVDSIGELLTDLSQNQETFEMAKDVLQGNLDTILDTIFPTEEPETPEDPDNPDEPTEPSTPTAEETYKAMISETINSIFSADYTQEENNIANEITVVTETLKVADKLMSEDPDNTFTQDDADAVIKALDNSTVILGTLESSTESDVRQLLQTVASNETVAGYINDAINNPEFEITNKDLLMEIFGITTQPEPTPPADPEE